MEGEAIKKLGEETLNCLVAQIKHHFRFLSHFHNNLANLSTKVDDLKDKSGRVQRLVDEAERNLDEIEDDVRRWLDKVKNEMIEAERILEDEDKVGNGCWNGWCLNLNLRYDLSRNAIEKALNLDALLLASGFVTVARPRLPPGVVRAPTAPHVPEATSASTSIAVSIPGGFGSRSSTLRGVIEALEDNSIRVIRICGMGGVGKTTMLKEVEKWVREAKLFDEIGKAEWTDNPNIRLIQDCLARSLGLKLEEDDALSERAGRLSERLDIEKKRILVIVDNVWRRKDMEEVGLPLSNQQMRCKILLTSRSEEVCAGLRFEKMFKIAVLSDEEAWVLFQDTVGPLAYDLCTVAKKIVKQCGGLPLAITTIASALSEAKTKVIWDDVLGQLQKSSLMGDYAAVFNSLKASYKFLEPQEMKDCFLLCCLFPEGYDVPIEDLVRYGNGLRLFKNVDSLQDTRTRAHAYVRKLVNSNLLLVSGREECIKMHDLVRDFALKTASELGLYMVRHGHGPSGVTEWPMEDTYKHYTSISVRFSEMNEVPVGLDCPNLKLLQLLADRQISKSPENFYNRMGRLNVLAFMRMFIPLPPNSLQLLSNLRTLSFNYFWEPTDISSIVNLEKLEVLSFARSSITQIPREIGKLSRLRLLDLTGCYIDVGFAPGALLSLIRLEELYMRCINTRHKESAEKIQGMLDEIKSLPKLVILDIDIPYEVLPTDFMFDNLEKFKISIQPSSFPYFEAEHRFKLDQFSYQFPNSLRLISPVLQDKFKVVFKKIEVMYLQVQGLGTLLNDSEKGDFSNMKRLIIQCCKELVHLVNTLFVDQNNVFPMLEELFLYDLNNLEEIYHHVQHPMERFSEITESENILERPAQLASFGNLRILRLGNCHKLENIFYLLIARGLVMLERLEISTCKMMKELFFNNRGGDQEEETDAVGKIEFSSLKHLSLCSLPNLVSFCKAADAVVLPQLVELEIIGLPELTSLFAEVNSSASNEQNHPLFNQKGIHSDWVFQKLRSLKVQNCDSLRQMCTPSIATFLGELQRLEVESCSSLQAIVAAEGNGEKEVSTVDRILFPQLNYLRLRSLPNLLTITPEGYILRWLSLKTLILKDCGRESDIFTNMNSSLKGGNHHEILLANLEYIEIYRTDITGLWKIHFPAQYSYKLKKMVLTGCNTELPVSRLIKGYDHLEVLYLEDCDSIKVVFNLEDSIVGGKPRAVTLSRLGVLSMKYLPRMTHVWKKRPQGFEGFCNLSKLYLIQCKSVRYLFSPSIAKLLVKLEVLFIRRCEVMEEFVSRRDEVEDQQNQVDDVFFFPELTNLWLDGLPSLVCIGPTETSDGANDNTIISSLSSVEKVSVSGTESSKSCATSVTLEVIARSQFPAWSFCNLTRLFVSECHKLLYAIPSNTVARLQKLKELIIFRCDSLVQIFEDEQHLSASLFGFPKLCYVSVNGCDSMKYIFRSSTVKRLSQIKNLVIRRCKMMEVIVKEEETEAEEGDRMSKLVVFPYLESLTLESLPRLTGIWLGSHEFEWPNLKSVTIKECREMKIFTTGFSSTPHLNTINVNFTEYYSAEEDLNTTIMSAQQENEKGDESEDEDEYESKDEYESEDEEEEECTLQNPSSEV